MMPELYNPTTDGLAACLWEIHRANAAFRRDADLLLRNRDEGDAPPTAFAAAALAAITSARPADLLDLTWPEIPLKVRDALENAAKGSVPSAKRGELPNQRLATLVLAREALGEDHFTDSDREQLARFGYAVIADLLRTQSIPLLVPSELRSRSEVVRVLAEVKTLLPKPSNTSAALDAAARACGTARAWQLYRFYEWAKSISGDDERALRATVVRQWGQALLGDRGKINRREFWRDWMRHSSVDVLYKKLIQQRSSQARREISSITGIIEQAYPRLVG